MQPRLAAQFLEQALFAQIEIGERIAKTELARRPADLRQTAGQGHRIERADHGTRDASQPHLLGPLAAAGRQPAFGQKTGQLHLAQGGAFQGGAGGANALLRGRQHLAQALSGFGLVAEVETAFIERRSRRRLAARTKVAGAGFRLGAAAQTLPAPLTQDGIVPAFSGVAKNEEMMRSRL